MNEDTFSEIFYSIISIFIFFGVFGGMAKLGIKGFQKQMAEMNKYKFTGPVPAKLYTISNATLGGKTQYSNLLKMAERDGMLYIKFPFKLTYAVPYKSLQSVHVDTKGNRKIAILTMKETEKPFMFTLHQGLWGQFPELLKMAEHKQPKPQVSSHTAPKNPSQSLSTEAIQSKMGNLIRAFVLLAAVLVGIYFLALS